MANIPCLLELEEIIHELKDYIVSLNTGRWGYVTDIIKTFRDVKRDQVPIPPRDEISMNCSYLEAFALRVIHIAHK